MKTSKTSLYFLYASTVIKPDFTHLSSQSSDECDDCEHIGLGGADGYCYMFKEKPKTACMAGKYKPEARGEKWKR